MGRSGLNTLKPTMKIPFLPCLDGGSVRRLQPVVTSAFAGEHHPATQ